NGGNAAKLMEMIHQRQKHDWERIIAPVNA
ncbi:MAG: hypothetical protein QOI53_3342, partial [Verrucomicrobiota bacterium]|nr:hypothetical protein [Verrucomicrobiota bacterium]